MAKYLIVARSLISAWEMGFVSFTIIGCQNPIKPHASIFIEKI